VLSLLVVVVVLLALVAATFVLSYDGVRAVALEAGVSVSLARFYPGVLDAALVIACAAALLLRDGKWWARWYAWFAVILIVAVAGATDTVHAMSVSLPHKQTEGVVAAAPWVLVLLAFSLWITILRQSRAGRRPAPPVPAPVLTPAPPVLAVPAPAPAVPAPAVPAPEQTAPVPTGAEPADIDSADAELAGSEAVSAEEGSQDGVAPEFAAQEFGATQLPDERLPTDSPEYRTSADPAERAPVTTHVEEEPAGPADAEAAAPVDEVFEEEPGTNVTTAQAPAELSARPEEPQATAEETPVLPEEAPGSLEEVSGLPAEPEQAAPEDTAAARDEAPAAVRRLARSLDYWDVEEDADYAGPADGGSRAEVRQSLDDDLGPQGPESPSGSATRFRRVRSTPVPPGEETDQDT
jgi:hypothetical protein